MSKLLYSTVLALSLFHAATAQSKLPQEAEGRLICHFPFRQYYGGVVVILAQLKGFSDTLQFILDTGSAGISLDTSTCVRLGIALTPSERVVRGVGGSKRVDFAMNRTLVLPELEVDSLNFHVNNYELISQVYGLQVDGIIGYSLLSRYNVLIDYNAEEVRLYTKGKFTYPKGGTLLHPTLTNIPIVNAQLRNGKTQRDSRYYFDTGAGMCLLFSKQYVTDSTILSTRKKQRKVIQTEAQGLGGKMTMDVTTIGEFKIGNFSFRNVPVYVFDDQTNITAYPFLGGMVGNDLLRRFNIYLNYGKKEIYLLPNDHFKEPFDYSYTGLVIYLIDGKIEITDIIKDSPAEKAGLKTGDIIMAINNVFTNNIQEVREQLKNVGTRPLLLISRNHELMLKKVLIKSIL
ncbi:aspartyl protease family protein [Chitinophaga sancti]|uniref:Aspartyl protease family protein n=1 Tax=Chitinophaga sancti TaxID=1004 RepID=A0A1K1P2D1_9BACT|nr:aspartyl protease family protein [Chitinophaga sancti]WQD60419.1 aspartyl protease family protein [Chitinophaga sancti]WQG87453.1 aspartyl protease family protein [Chitinophaga sancti]SFW41732.1 PDZ domain (Also known as DHR or GLGF) [Chitinophaga sancti]